MTREEKQWDRLKADYLRHVEQALSSVRHPRAKDVLSDVRSHLDRRVAELPPEQRTADNLRAIITDMGPASDYAELLEPNGSASAHRVPKKSIAWIGAVAVVAVVIVALIVSTLSGPVRRSPEASVGGLDALPELIASLSDPEAPRFVALNKIIKIGSPAVPALIEEMQTSYNWQIPKALGAIGDWRAVGPLIEKLGKSDFSPMQEVVAEALGRITGAEFGVSAEKWRTWWEQTGQNMSRGVSSGADIDRTGTSPVVYIVTFKPVEPFVPQTARELLEAFNKNHPRGVRTHHYRAHAKDNALVGSICVDGEAGKDAVVAMLADSEELEPVQVERATPGELEERYRTSQRSSSRSGGTSPRTREPTSRNRMVTRSGTWPPGSGSVRGQVYRESASSRIGHGKVCLSSAEYGTWVVEMQDHGDFDFENLPAGVYTLKTTDTFGYKDSYYTADANDPERTSFQLNDGQRLYARLKVEPARPYRQIAGTVLGEDGTPLLDSTFLRVTAWVRKPQGPWQGHFRWISSAFVNDDGSYVLDQLDGREVYVQVRDGRPPSEDRPFPPRFYPGTFSRAEAKLVTFGDAQVVENVDITMQKKGGLILEGIVTDGRTGDPVPEALVSLFHFDMFFDLFYTYTNEQGRYRMEGLGEGRFIVHVDAVHKGYVKTRKIVAVEPNVSRPELDFALNPGVTISGHFVDGAGRPYPVGRMTGSAYVKGGGSRIASNFCYGNKYAPSYIRDGLTIFSEIEEGDQPSAMFTFPSETSFLLPAMMPGQTFLRTQGLRVAAIRHEGRDIRKSGLVTERGQSIRDVTIVLASARDG